MANKHDTLTSLFTAIANAIRGKTGSSDQIVADDFPSAISLISGTDTSDATATAEDIANGKTAYVNGKKIEGSVDVVDSEVGYLSSIEPEFVKLPSPIDKYAIGIKYSRTVHRLIRRGVTTNHMAEASSFGTATAADVAEGKTFTSAAGLKVTGTHKCETPSGTVEITENGTHDVTSYASANVNVPSSGIDTTETTSPRVRDIAEGKIAFVNGEKVTGSVHVTTGTINILPQSTKLVSESTSLHIDYTLGKDNMYRNNTEMVLSRPLSDFGDAEAADVAAGKTFTSTAGLKVTGTYEGGGIHAQRITSASETITISGSGTVKVWGYGYKSGQYGGTTYAFVGDGYYSGNYGTPSKTNAIFSISNGTLSGLPDGLTALDVLVTIGV